MPTRVLIIPDKFKGTLSAGAAAAAIARGWSRSRTEDRLELLPMSDGGDGFGEVMSRLLGGKPQLVRTVDASHRPCTARWWWVPRDRTAIIESATVIGLAMLPPGRFHPFDLDTFGLGAVLQAVWKKGARCCLVGIGGSATNDGGFGLARALGWGFLTSTGEEIERWPDLHRLRELQAPPQAHRAVPLLVAVDVQNRLLGLQGATRVYGAQKGLRPANYAPSERCLGTLARVCRDRSREDFASQPGAGAAGGLGFGLSAFAGGRLTPGFDMFAKYAGLDRRLRSSEVVITGEGALDRSTLMGKGVGQVAERCRRLTIPCIGLAGRLESTTALRRAFAAAHALTEITSVDQAKANPRVWLERLAARAAREFSAGLGAF